MLQANPRPGFQRDDEEKDRACLTLEGLMPLHRWITPKQPSAPQPGIRGPLSPMMLCRGQVSGPYPPLPICLPPNEVWLVWSVSPPYCSLYLGTKQNGFSISRFSLQLLFLLGFSNGYDSDSRNTLNEIYREKRFSEKDGKGISKVV